VLVEHHMRRDRPDFWTASLDGRGIWSYDLNIARGWAAALLGEPLVSAQGEHFLDAHHAFLPLPLARVVSALGGGLSGPIDGKYRYVTGDPSAPRVRSRPRFTGLRPFTLGCASRRAGNWMTHV
jgi:hypothetical protein